ncbi:hypothetical protein FJY71_04385, partial [candidate division WOR-3 bacterium]|nr:hypothetical protein [candidate division WOR-3 bacterium]
MLRRLMLLLLVAFGPAAAQEPSLPAGVNVQGLLQAPVSPLTSLVGVESPIISEKYVLMPGDRLLVTVTGGVTYSYQTWITYEGKITLDMPTATLAPSISSGASVSFQSVDAIRISG